MNNEFLYVYGIIIILMFVKIKIKIKNPASISNFWKKRQAN